MFKALKKKIKYSKWNFYYLNLRFNASFWLKSKKLYKHFTVQVKTDDFTIDEIGKMHYTFKTVKKKRFAGYMYKGGLYWDNPGLKIKDRELWKHWKGKNLIK